MSPRRDKFHPAEVASYESSRALDFAQIFFKSEVPSQ